MKRNSLTTAVVACIAGVAGFAGLANAVNLNPDGLGQVLIYPYYTVNNGQQTILSVVNTTDIGKAVKVRFLEGYNSREVRDFNVFLSPHDVWVAAITAVDPADPASGAKVLTNDSSCIVQPGSEKLFVTYGFDGGTPGQGADDGPQTIDRTREGYFEIITMGDISRGSQLESAITHDQSSTPGTAVPANCGYVAGATVAQIDADLEDVPTGGLFGAAAVVNTEQGTYFSYNADAIDGFTESAVYTDSGSLQPSLQQASTPSIATNGVARSYVFTGEGRLLTVDYADGADAVSAVFMADAIYNEYNRQWDLMGASSDWIITFPTKRFYVDKVLYPGNPTSPFVQPFSDGKSNVTATFTGYDREEQTSTLGGCDSPVGPDCFAKNPVLPYEVNALSFTAEKPTNGSTVLGSHLNAYIIPFGLDGWAQIDLASGDGGHALDRGIATDGSQVSLHGLPVTGFYATNIINNQLQGPDGNILSNYSGVYRHRAHRSCTGSDAACS